MLNIVLCQLGVDYKPADTVQDSQEPSSNAEEGLGWRFDQQAEMLHLVLQRLGVSDESVDATRASSSLAAYIGSHRDTTKAHSRSRRWGRAVAAARLSARHDSV